MRWGRRRAQSKRFDNVDSRTRQLRPPSFRENSLQQPQGLRARLPGGTARVWPSLNFTAIGAFVALKAR